MAEQELRKKLTRELKCHTLIPGSAFGVFIEDIIALFKEAGYVRLAGDQSLPENSHYVAAWQVETREDTQQDMLKAKFRKVEL